MNLDDPMQFIEFQDRWNELVADALNPMITEFTAGRQRGRFGGFQRVDSHLGIFRTFLLMGYAQSCLAAGCYLVLYNFKHSWVNAEHSFQRDPPKVAERQLHSLTH